MHPASGCKFLMLSLGHLSVPESSLVVCHICLFVCLFVSTYDYILRSDLLASFTMCLDFLFFLQVKLLRQCLQHVAACRDLRKKLGIGGSCSTQKGSRATVLC